MQTTISRRGTTTTLVHLAVVMIVAILATVALTTTSAAAAESKDEAVSTDGEGSWMEGECLQDDGMFYERTNSKGQDIWGCYDPVNETSSECLAPCSDPLDERTSPGPDEPSGLVAQASVEPGGGVVLDGSTGSPASQQAPDDVQVEMTDAGPEPLPRYMGTAQLRERCSEDGGSAHVGPRLAECTIYRVAIWKCVRARIVQGNILWSCRKTGATPSLIAQLDSPSSPAMQAGQ